MMAIYASGLAKMSIFVLAANSNHRDFVKKSVKMGHQKFSKCLFITTLVMSSAKLLLQGPKIVKRS